MRTKSLKLNRRLPSPFYINGSGISRLVRKRGLIRMHGEHSVIWDVARDFDCVGRITWLTGKRMESRGARRKALLTTHVRRSCNRVDESEREHTTPPTAAMMPIYMAWAFENRVQARAIEDFAAFPSICEIQTFHVDELVHYGRISFGLAASGSVVDACRLSKKPKKKRAIRRGAHKPVSNAGPAGWNREHAWMAAITFRGRL